MAGATIKGPSAASGPLDAVRVLIETKASFASGWTLRPELRLSVAQAATAGHDMGQCEVTSEYGDRKLPHETGYSQAAPLDLLGHWLRVRLLGQGGDNVAWVGQINSEARKIMGSQSGAAGLRTGRQTWVAQDANSLLMKRRVSDSTWRVDGEEQDLEWAPWFNQADAFGRVVGNRSSAKSNGTYLFSATDGDLWTRLDALEYVLLRYADESAENGPAWTIGGQTELLAAATDTVPMSRTQTAREVVRAIVSPKMGIDYKLVPTNDGFEVHVFALRADDATFAGVSAPKNPNTVGLDSSESIRFIDVNVVRSRDQRYSKIRVRGERAVVCCTLDATVGDLVPKWPTSKEADYDAAFDPAENAAFINDFVRRIDEYRPVYAQFGAPDDWDHNAGGAAPNLIGDGTISGAAHRQRYVRRTLPSLPLREGVDYTTSPATDNNPGDHEPDWLPPAAWIYDEEAARWIPANSAGIGVSASQADWGILLSASPNHIMARGHFAGAAPSEVEPQYDYDNLVATIAIESDQRLMLELDTGEDGSVLDVDVQGAEFWYLAPGTVLGADGEGALVSAGEGVVLRDDTARLAAVMAGAVARYLQDRARARIVAMGLLPWGDLLGHILSYVEDGGDTQAVGAPITRVRWIGGENPRTELSTGFAK